MNPILKNILAVIAGALIGMSVNMALIMNSHSIIPYPEGMILGDMKSLSAHISDFETKHFIMPFLAHALGTLVGAFVAAKFAATRKMLMALVIGVFFLIGGITMVIDMPETPTWFAVLDIVGAYLPMVWIGTKIAKA